MARNTNSSYKMHVLTTVGFAGRVILVAFLLIATSGCGEKAKETVEQVGRNFLEEFVAQVGIHPRNEGLGLSGSNGLQIESTIESCYTVFVDQFASSKLQIVPAQNVISNRVYQDLLANQPDTLATLFKYLGRDVLTPRPRGKNNKIVLAKPQTLAVITFAAFNGDLGLVFGVPGLRLLILNEDRLSSLATSLRTDFLAAVTLVPRIKKFGPLGKLGSASVSYRIRVFDQYGKVVIDEPVVGNLSQPQRPIRFIGVEIPFIDRLKMGLSKTFFAFPTDAQKQQLVQIEKTLMSKVVAELPSNLVRHINE